MIWYNLKFAITQTSFYDSLIKIVYRFSRLNDFCICDFPKDLKYVMFALVFDVFLITIIIIIFLNFDYETSRLDVEDETTLITCMSNVKQSIKAYFIKKEDNETF